MIACLGKAVFIYNAKYSLTNRINGIRKGWLNAWGAYPKVNISILNSLTLQEHPYHITKSINFLFCHFLN